MTESREQTETHPEDREQGTPQGQLVGDEPGTDERLEPSDETPGRPEEGGADSAADAGSEGG
jgi:hypothetical protein